MTETKSPVTEIFVFGSNEAGRHGRGAARDARRRYGAQYGVGVGRTGNAYAVPTKDRHLRPLPLSSIEQHVARFLAYARDNPCLMFKVTAIGTGLAGYRHEDIVPMFAEAPVNCRLPGEWRALAENAGAPMRGTFDVESGTRSPGDAAAQLTGHLTRAADGRAYGVSLWVSHDGLPHPETDEIRTTRVLSGGLVPMDLSGPRRAVPAPEHGGLPYELGKNNIVLIQNLADAAAAITHGGKLNERREAAYYGLANIDGVVERVAVWEADQAEGLSVRRLLGHTRAFTPNPDFDLEDQMEEARRAMCAGCPARPQAPGPAMRTRRPRAGQGTA